MEEEKEEIAIPAVPVDFFQLMIDGSSKQWRWGRRGESSNRSQWREERLLIEKMSMRKKMQLGRYPCSRCNQPRSRGGETSMATAAAAAAAKCRCSRRRRLPEQGVDGGGGRAAAAARQGEPLPAMVEGRQGNAWALR